MKKMTKFFALALLAGAMVSCSTEDIAPSTQNDKVAVQFTGGISVNTRAAGVAWADGFCSQYLSFPIGNGHNQTERVCLV